VFVGVEAEIFGRCSFAMGTEDCTEAEHEAGDRSSIFTMGTRGGTEAEHGVIATGAGSLCFRTEAEIFDQSSFATGTGESTEAEQGVGDRSSILARGTTGGTRAEHGVFATDARSSYFSAEAVGG